MNLLITFIILNVANVIIQTIKSIATVKCGKTIAALANAVAYGLYTFVVIYMTIDGINIWVKAGIIALANFIGVYVVKVIEQKLEKEKLWKIELAIPIASHDAQDIHHILELREIPNNWTTLGSWNIFNCYCMTKHQTKICQSIAKDLHGKISAYQAAPLA